MRVNRLLGLRGPLRPGQVDDEVHVLEGRENVLAFDQGTTQLFRLLGASGRKDVFPHRAESESVSDHVPLVDGVPQRVRLLPRAASCRVQ